MPSQVTEPAMPECERMVALKDKSDLLTDFVDWLGEQPDVELCRVVDDDNMRPSRSYLPLTMTYEKLFARFFEIDLDKVEKEKREALACLRTKHAEKDIRKTLCLEDGSNGR